MANHKGSEGVVKISASPEITIAELKGWSYSTTNNTIDDTELTDTWTTKKPGTSSWTGTIDCFWDETDTTGQGALTTGAEVTVIFYPEGAAAAATGKTGACIVTGINSSGAIDGMVEASYSVEGNGALTDVVVP